MSKQLKAGDYLYHLSNSGTISKVSVVGIKDGIAYTSDIDLTLDPDITNGITVIKNIWGGEVHLPMRELDEMYQKQIINFSFNAAMLQIKKTKLTTSQKERILNILNEKQ